MIKTCHRRNSDGVGKSLPVGNIISRQFDALDRPTALDWTAAEPNAGAHDAEFSYIGGRLLTRKTFGFTTREVRDINDPTRSGYDGLGRPVYLNYGAGTLTFGYDAVSNRTFQFDSNRVGTDPAAGGNGVRDLETYGYDNVYRLIQHTTGVAVSPPTVASSVTQTGDTRLTGQPTAAPAVPGAPAREQEWSLDGVGSWAQFTIDGITQTNQTGDINQYTEFAGHQLDHAPNGNTVRDAPTVAAAGFAYEFDAFNRSRRVFDPATNATVGLYSYDAAGRRVTRQADIDHDGTLETNVRYLFDGARVIEERLLADQPGIGLRGDLLRQYVYGLYIDEPLWTELTAAGADLANLPFAGAPPPVLNAANQPLALAAAPPLALAGQYLFAQDANFNVYALFDATGAIVEQYRHDAYGTFQLYDGFGTELAAKNAPSLLNPYLFQGRRYDPESGLFYFRARFYNPFTGRFLSFDPLGYIDGMGLFEFVSSSPVMGLDPTGTIGAVEAVLIVAAVALVIGAIFLDAASDAQKTNLENQKETLRAAGLAQQSSQTYDPAIEQTEKCGERARSTADMASGVIPVVGDANDVQAVVSGQSAVTGEPVPLWAAIIGVAVPIVGAAIVARWFSDWGPTVARSADDAGTAGRSADVPVVGRWKTFTVDELKKQKCGQVARSRFDSL